MQHVICQLRPGSGPCPAAWSDELGGYDSVPPGAADDGGLMEDGAACQWCCHPYDGATVRMPTGARAGDAFVTTGQFCSWPCAAAAIFHERGDTNGAWTRYQALNDMAGRTVPRAPPREALRAFGGTMAIERFRALADANVAAVPRQPPMIVEHLRLEEIPAQQLYRNIYHPLDEARVDRYKAKLERARPPTPFFRKVE